jgi:hypothetical protein
MYFVLSMFISRLTSLLTRIMFLCFSSYNLCYLPGDSHHQHKSEADVSHSIRRMFTYMDFTICFTLTHFNEPDSFNGYPKLCENTVQYCRAVDNWFQSFWLWNCYCWIWGFFMSMNSWCTASSYYNYFSSTWRMPTTSSVVDLLHQNPHWRSPIISSPYGLSLERRIFHYILYEVYSSDIPQLLQPYPSFVSKLVQ